MSLEEPVVEAEDQVVDDAPVQEEESAQEPSLDELLNEFEQQQPKEEEPKETKKTDENKAIMEFVKQQMSEQAEARVQKDISQSVKLAKEAGEVGLPDVVVESFLRHRIQSDQRLLGLWQGRDKNRASFDSVIKSLGRELSKSLGDSVDKSVTDSVDALASAVKSSSKSTPNAEKTPDFLNMSSKDLEKWKDANLR